MFWSLKLSPKGVEEKPITIISAVRRVFSGLIYSVQQFSLDPAVKVKKKENLLHKICATHLSEKLDEFSHLVLDKKSQQPHSIISIYSQLGTAGATLEENFNLVLENLAGLAINN